MGRSAATASSVSVTGMSSSRVTKCTAVVADRSSRMIESAWLRIGPTLARPATAACTLRNRAIRPVGGASKTTASYALGRFLIFRRTASYTLPVSRTSRSPGAIEVAKSTAPEAVEGPSGNAEVIEGVEILDQRILGVDRQAVNRATCRRTTDSPLLRAGQRGYAEEFGDAAASFDLAEQDSPTAASQCASQAGGHRGFACAALPADDVQGVPGSHEMPVIAMPAWVL